MALRQRTGKGQKQRRAEMSLCRRLPGIKAMTKDYLRYNEITRTVLNALRTGYDQEKLAPLMEERNLLFERFEDSGWPDSEQAVQILEDTLKLEMHCVKIIAGERARLKDEMQRLANQKYALQQYATQTAV